MVKIERISLPNYIYMQSKKNLKNCYKEGKRKLV